MKTALSIAGSDCSGGAGIQADIKTMTMNGVYAMSVVTALTAQNTTGVTGISEVSADFLKKQIEAIFIDIRPDAIKIGMVPNAKLMETIAECLNAYQAKNIVVDPVMVATSGSSLMESEAVVTLKNKLLPIATLVTPNIPEAEVLSGMEIVDKDSMVNAAKYISESYGCAVLLKGGHSINDANDLFYTNGHATWYHGKRIDNPNTHGTGCTLSSAIASNLAKGYELSTAIQRAKDYISGALAAMLDLGKGSGPMNHAFNLSSEFIDEKSKYKVTTVKLAKNDTYQTTISYDERKQTIQVDRSASGFDWDMLHSRTFYVYPKKGQLKLRVIMDKNSLELFVNDGEQAASFLLFTPIEVDGITFAAENKVRMTLEKYDLIFEEERNGK